MNNKKQQQQQQTNKLTNKSNCKKKILQTNCTYHIDEDVHQPLHVLVSCKQHIHHQGHDTVEACEHTPRHGKLSSTGSTSVRE